MDDHSCLILGVGNLLLGDEGVGIHVVHRLQKMHLPPHVEVIDGGTGGFELVSLCRNKKKIIIIDAMLADTQPGSVVRATPQELQLQWKAPLSAHHAGLRELLDVLQIQTPTPVISILGIVPAVINQPSMELSPRLLSKLESILALVLKEVDQ